MDVGSGGMAPGFLTHGTYKVEGGFMVLFFGLVFSVLPHPGNFSVDVLG